MKPNDSEPRPDELDGRIRDALRVEPSSEQLARLEAFWREQVRLERQRDVFRKTVVWSVVAAGAAAVLIGASILFSQRTEDGGRRVADEPSESAVETPVKQERAVADEHDTEPEAKFVLGGRAPTVYERFLFASHCPPSGSDEPPPPPPAPTSLTQHDQTDKPIDRPADPDRLVALLRRTDDPTTRAELLRRLLAAGSDSALCEYLALVRDDMTRDEALAAVETVSGPTLDGLLALLTDEDQTMRLSAALVLGRANGPEVANALIELVTRKPATPEEARIARERNSEAWIAIMQCRGRQVEQFLACVQHSPKLLGPFNRALARWRLMTL
jgi:hypothetical protein